MRLISLLALATGVACDTSAPGDHGPNDDASPPVSDAAAAPIDGADLSSSDAGAWDSPPLPVFVVSWGLEHIDGGALTCAEAGTESVKLTLRARRTGTSVSFTFACHLGSGVTEPLPSDNYAVSVVLLDAHLRAVSILQGEFDLRPFGRTALDQVLFRIQSWSVSWSITREGPAGPQAVSCDQVAATTVELTDQLGGESTVDGHRFPCHLGTASSTAIRLGSRTYRLRLLDKADQPLAENMSQLFVVGEQARAKISETFALEP